MLCALSPMGIAHISPPNNILMDTGQHNVHTVVKPGNASSSWLSRNTSLKNEEEASLVGITKSSWGWCGRNFKKKPKPLRVGFLYQDHLIPPWWKLLWENKTRERDHWWSFRRPTVQRGIKNQRKTSHLPLNWSSFPQNPSFVKPFLDAIEHRYVSKLLSNIHAS